MAPKLPSLGVDEIKNDPQGFGKALFAELLGTAILVSQPGSETSQFILYMFLEDRSHHNKADHVFASMNTFFLQRCLSGVEAAWEEMIVTALQNWVSMKESL